MALFDSFIQERKFLKNVSPRTVEAYHKARKHWLNALPEQAHDAPTKADLTTFVMYLRERGLSIGACNVYIRHMNAFLSWLASEGHSPQRLKMSLLKGEIKQIDTFNDAEVTMVVAFKPKGFYELRTWTLVMTLLDTGCRIDELLTCRESEGLDMDNCLLTVLGKGRKVRRIPFSLELRKVLFRYGQQKGRRGISGYVFCTGDGLRLRYRNVYRDIEALCRAAGILSRVHPHKFRHTFATNFIRRGGNLFVLSRLLGHSSIQITQRYLHLQTEDLQREHSQFAGLSVS